jgi:hypothetical protein
MTETYLADRIIMGTNEDPTYFDFWKIQVLAHRTFFPFTKLTIAILTNTPDRPIFNEMREAGVDVYPYQPSRLVPHGNQAKLLRYYCAAQFRNESCIVSDIDTIPMQSEYVDRIGNEIVIAPDKLLAVGKEVLINGPDSGKFPAHHTAGLGGMFDRLYRCNGKTFAEVVEQYIGMKTFDHKENVMNLPFNFSDESLNRALIHVNGVAVKDITRNIDIQKQWIDRSWWNIDEQFMQADGYIEANLLRPFADHYEQILPIIKYIESKGISKYHDI